MVQILEWLKTHFTNKMFTFVVNNVLLGTDLADGSSPRLAFGPAPGAFAFVDPLIVPFGPNGIMFPGVGQGFPPVVTFGHPTVSFP